MNADPPPSRVTVRGPELGRAVRGLREGLGLSGREFIGQLARAGGPPLDPGKLSRIESGERGLAVAEWHRLVRAISALGASAPLVELLAGLLPPPPELIEPLPPRSLSSMIEHWYTIARAITSRPVPRLAMTGNEPPAARGVAAMLFVARYREALEGVLRRAALHSDPAEAVPGDRVVVIAVDPAETRVAPNTAFEIRLRMRNAGTTDWGDNRLLLRLGPPITSTIAQTAPLVPVPPTSAGDTCDILVPGRGHYLPGRCVVTYVMVFANGRPCLPGGLSLPISSVATTHSTLSLSDHLVALFRRSR